MSPLCAQCVLMYQRALPLALVHVAFTLLCTIGSLITQQHSVWSLIAAFVMSHVCTGFLVCIYMGQRDDDMGDERILAARPYILGLLVTSVFALVMAGLVGTIVIMCHPAVVTGTPFVVGAVYAAEVTDEWVIKKPTVVLFLVLAATLFAGHLMTIIWASVLVRRSNVYWAAARL